MTNQVPDKTTTNGQPDVVLWWCHFSLSRFLQEADHLSYSKRLSFQSILHKLASLLICFFLTFFRLTGRRERLEFLLELYDGSESPILHNSNLFHAIQISFHATRNSFHTIPNLFHATRNLFRATPNMFPLILHLVCNICKNNFHHPIWSWNLRVLFTCASETQHETNQPIVRVDGGVLLS